jgi:ribosome-binding protein aMBF1 (putative translation factor)
LLSTISVGLDEKDFDPYLWVMLSPEQSRAARAWLDWSQQDLATRAKVSLSTVRDFEKGRRTPIANNLEAMARALKSAGMELTSGPDGAAVGIAKRV